MFTLDLPTEFGSSTMLEVGGKFHAVIKDVEENPILGDKPFRGFQVELEIVEPKEQAEKTAKLLFGNPDMSHKDKGEFAKAKQASFAIATNMVDLSKLGQSVDIDLSAAIGQHVLIELEMKPSKNDPSKHYPELRYSNIFHVDDPRSKGYPRNDDALKAVGAHRQPESYFAPLLKKKTPPPTTKATDDDFAGL
jgi:hypothetical protein